MKKSTEIKLDTKKLLGLRLIKDQTDECDPILSAKIGISPPPMTIENMSNIPSPTVVTESNSTLGNNILDIINGSSDNTNNNNNNNYSDSDTESSFSTNYSALLNQSKLTGFNTNFMGFTPGTDQNIWLLASTEKGDIDHNSTTFSIEYDSHSIAIGTDIYNKKATKVGVFGSYSNTDAEHNKIPNSSSDSDFFHIGAYTQIALQNPWYLSGVISTGWGKYNTSRFTNIGIPKSSSDARNYWGIVNIVYKYNFINYILSSPSISVFPFGQLEFNNTSTNNYTEKGAGATRVKNKSVTKFYSVLGAKILGEVYSGNIKIIPKLKIAWAHQFADKDAYLTTRPAYLASPNLVGNDINIKRNSARIDIGAKAVASNNNNQSSLFINYRKNLASNAVSDTLTAGFVIDWL